MEELVPEIPEAGISSVSLEKILSRFYSVQRKAINKEFIPFQIIFFIINT